MIEFKFIEGDCFKVKPPENDWRAIGILNKIPGAKHVKSQNYWKFPLSVRIYKQLKEEFGISHPSLDKELGSGLIPLQIHNNKHHDTFGTWQHEAIYRVFKDFGFQHAHSKAFHHEGDCKKPLLPRGFGLFMEMGTRKTSTSINIVDTLHVNGFVQKALVIAPLSIVDTWGNKDPKVGELAKHSSINHLTFTLTGTKSNKDKVARVMHMQAKSKTMKWTLINPESIGKRVKIKKKKTYQYNFDFENLLPDVVIIDESTIIQNHDTARGELIERLLYLAPYKIIMSGNPIPKGGHQVFGQYLFMDKGIYGDNYFKFKNKFFEINYFKGIDGIKKEKEKEFNELFHSGCFVVRKDECLELPPKVYERRYYQMSPEQAKAYAQMKKDAVATMDDLTCSAEVVITKYLRLSQIAGGFLPLEDEMGKLVELRRFKDQPGLDLMIVDLLSLPTDEQVVIWARFKEEIEMIQERLTKEGVSCAVFYGPSSKEERIEARRQFRDKEIKAIVCSSAAARGLNDFIGSNYSFRYSNDYSADNRGQSEDRQHRSGVVGEKVLYVDYVAQGTIDEDVLDILQSNKDYSTALLELRKSKKKQAASD